MGGILSCARTKNIPDTAENLSDGPPNPHLCVCCQQIFEDWDRVHHASENSWIIYPHHQDSFAFERSVKNGCHLCSLFVGHDMEVLKRDMDSAANELKNGGRCGGLTIKVSRSFLPTKSGDKSQDFVVSPDWRLELSIRFIRGGSNKIVSHLLKTVDVITNDDSIIGSTMTTQNSRDKSHGSTNDLKSVSGGYELINTVRPLACLSQWFERCCNSHKECKTSGVQVTPTRLVFLARGGPRLCVSTEFAICPKYATLSHCWGAAEFPTLNKTNFPVFREEIPPSALQRTFKDAMAICEHVGIRYLWIDSLCILQGDEEDWNREAPLMCDVYGGSSLNIAASGASDGSQGCFFDRDGRLPLAFKVQAMADKKWRPYFCVLTDLYGEKLHQMPLLRRSWAFQERLLSPRTVHFTTTEVFWECNGLIACETFPRGYPVSLRYGDSFWTKQPITRVMWPWVLQQYSMTGLTYSKDKLPAISGIAQQMQLETGDAYASGLWSQVLEDQLCWHTFQNQFERDGRAPSWSWASVDGIVRWRDLGAGSVHIRVLEFPSTPLGRSSQPENSSGKLLLYGSSLFVTTIPKSHRQGDSCVIFGSLHGYLRKVSRSELFLDFDCPSASELDSSHEIYFLPCRSYIEELEEFHRSLPQMMLKGLLLDHAVGSESAFQRIGVFQWFSLSHPRRPTPEETIALFLESLHDQGYRPRVVLCDRFWNDRGDEFDSNSAQQFNVELV